MNFVKKTKAQLQDELNHVREELDALKRSSIAVEKNSKNPTNRHSNADFITHDLIKNLPGIVFQFKVKEDGTINTVRLKKDTDNSIELSVQDNGIGIMDDLEKSGTKSLGMQLINILTAQIDGSLSIDSSENTIITIRFPF